MKRLLLPFLTIFFFTQLYAQFPYGTSWAAYTPGYQLTSGIATTYTPGFLYFGYQPTLQLGSWPWWPNNMNFFCKGFGASGIWTEYKVLASPGNCGGPLSQVINGVGVSAIEANGSNGVYLAVSGAFDKGCYFAGLSANGGTVATALFPFPQGAAMQQPPPTKPLIVQDRLTDDFFIAGAFNGLVYVIRLDNTGAQIWSSYYKVMGNAVPKDIIVNPHNISEIIVVGSTMSTPVNQDGFVLQLSSGTGNVVDMRTYGGPQTQESFNSITGASFILAANPDGFAIGGAFETATSQCPWIVKLDQNLSIIWSKRLQLNSGASAGCVDIMERINTSNGIEYYALVESSAGMVVAKLDDSGHPYPITTSTGGNEYIYNLAGLAPSVPACMTQVAATTSSTDAGIQVYGTASNWQNTKSSFVVKAYYNGETSCNGTFAMQSPALPGPAMVLTPGCSKFGQLGSCSSFGIICWNPGGTLNFPCSGYVISGSNQRMIQTGLPDEAGDAEELNIYPNPSAEKIQVDFRALAGQYVDIRLTDVIGKEVAVLFSDRVDLNGGQAVGFDHRQAGLKPGIYILKYSVNGEVKNHKLVFTD